jgi:broad specificity phosphatase PhoE
MATTVYLIRHGETVDADSRRYKGHIDVPLSGNGIKQLERLSEYLTQITNYRSQITDIKAVYSSGLDRALKSAEIIAKPFGLNPIVIDDLKERSFGVWEGMTFDEIKDKWPDAFNAWAENPLKFSPMEGENTLEVKERAMKAFNSIINKHKDEERNHQSYSM